MDWFGKLIGTFAGAQVSLDFTEGVTLVIEWTDTGNIDRRMLMRGLAYVLGGYGTVTARSGRYQWRSRIPYDDVLDGRLVELIDLLIDIRVNHPRMVQLPLALSEAEAQTLEKALNG